MSKSYGLDFATVFKRIRECTGLSQTDFAHSIGITSVTICNIESGKSFPSRQLLSEVEEEYGINPYVYAWANSESGGFGEAANAILDFYETVFDELEEQRLPPELAEARSKYRDAKANLKLIEEQLIELEGKYA